MNKHGLSGYAVKWTVHRAQQFVYGLEGRKLREVDATYRDQCLDVLGRNDFLQDWQMIQSINALKILRVDVVDLDWAAGRLLQDHSCCKAMTFSDSPEAFPRFGIEEGRYLWRPAREGLHVWKYFSKPWRNTAKRCFMRERS